MLELAVWTVVLARAWGVLASGVQHLRRPRHLDAVLATHRLPRVWPPVLRRGLGPLELLVGLLAAGGFLAGAPAPSVLPLAALYLGFTGYLMRLLRVAPGAACGCLGADEPAGWPMVVRAGLVAVAATVAVALSVPPGAGVRLAVGAAGVLVALVGGTLTRLLNPAG